MKRQMEANLREENLQKSLQVAVDDIVRKAQVRSSKIYNQQFKRNPCELTSEVALQVVQEHVHEWKNSMEKEIKLLLEEEEIPQGLRELTRIQTQFYKRYPDRKGIKARRPTNDPVIDARSIRMKEKFSYLKKCKDVLEKDRKEYADTVEEFKQKRKEIVDKYSEAPKSNEITQEIEKITDIPGCDVK